MKLVLTAAGLALAGVLAAPIALAQDADVDRGQPHAMVKDSVITTKVKSKLAAEHLGSLAHIRVDTDE
ncbi:MAG: transporter, partial [Gammaproteobacteria bacterium]|nr:transporter [Gammaproteobacteria bacterium]